MAFRIQCQTFFLTYPQCNLSHEDIKTDLFAKQIPRFTIKQYLIAKENHATEGTHFHVYLKLDKKFNCTTQAWFDIRGFHPNIQAARSPAKVVTYCAKDNDYIKSDDLEIDNKLTWAQMDQDITTVKQFMNNVHDNYPDKYWLNYDRLKSAAMQHFRPDAVEEPIPLELPAITTPAMDKWVNEELPSVRFAIINQTNPFL